MSRRTRHRLVTRTGEKCRSAARLQRATKRGNRLWSQFMRYGALLLICVPACMPAGGYLFSQSEGRQPAPALQGGKKAEDEANSSTTENDKPPK